jgi:hypothetical protein
VNPRARWMLESTEPPRLPLPVGAEVWRPMGDAPHRTYLDIIHDNETSPGARWQHLQRIAFIAGASADMVARFHYVVETDVRPEHEADFNAWYQQEHLPGLAMVPGAAQAARFVRRDHLRLGLPKYVACYRLVAPEVLESAPWQAVRHTAWSARVRPCFVNPRRLMFVASDERPSGAG